MTETKHANIYTALCAAQANMGKVVKDAVNLGFKSKYADLADVVSAVLPALNAQGIAYLSMVVTAEHGSAMRTILCHGESGTSVECDVPLLLGKQDMQSFKSATTYAKRIGLESLTGVAPDDDDGNAAAKSVPIEQQRQASRESVAEGYINEGQFRELRDLIDRSNTDLSAFLRHFGAKALPELPALKYAEAKVLLNRKIAEKATTPAHPAPAALDDEIPY